jgi:hypothetical protein
MTVYYRITPLHDQDIASRWLLEFTLNKNSNVWHRLRSHATKELAIQHMEIALREDKQEMEYDKNTSSDT